MFSAYLPIKLFASRDSITNHLFPRILGRDEQIDERLLQPSAFCCIDLFADIVSDNWGSAIGLEQQYVRFNQMNTHYHGFGHSPLSAEEQGNARPKL